MKNCFKYYKVCLVFIIALTSFSAHAHWLSCYNEKENRVYFKTMDEVEAQTSPSNTCSGSVFFVGPKGHSYITESFDENGQPTGRDGSEQIMRLDNGRQILISQWNNLTKVNEIIVLEPDFKNHVVRKYCQISNRGDIFSSKVDVKKRRLMINIQEYKNKTSGPLQRAWKACDIKL